MTFALDYTEKPFNGIKCKEFESRPEAEKWLTENKETVYWSCIRVKDAASALPQPIIPEDFDQSEYTKIEGALETFHETGMECMGLVLVDKTMHGPPNPAFDPSKPRGGANFEFYGNYNALHWFKTGDILQVDGSVKVGLLEDRAFATSDGYRLSFYPQGFTRAELVALFSYENVRATLWTKKTPITT